VSFKPKGLDLFSDLENEFLRGSMIHTVFYHVTCNPNIQLNCIT